MKRSKLLKLIIAIIIFILAFVLLINKNKNDNENLGDIKEDYFYVTPYGNERIVVKDIEAIYPRYFVIYVDNTDNTFIVHSFNYYNTISQYELEYRRVIKEMLDYDEDKLMIRYLYTIGIGDYESIINNIQNILNINNYVLYE